MDGYAVRADDTPGRLPVVFRIAAGVPAERALGPARRWRSRRAAPCPTARTRSSRSRSLSNRTTNWKYPAPVELGANVRPTGGDVRAGDLVLAAGTRIGAAQIGALAAAGVAEVLVAPAAEGRRPQHRNRAARARARRSGAGQIYESNAPMLAAAFEAAGAEVERIGPVADDEDEHRRALEHGLEADVLVSSGGVSVGPHDLVRRILAELGVEEDFWGVAVRPGKPLAFGVRGRDARLRAAGQPRLGARRRSSSSCGRRCSRCRVRPTRAGATRPRGWPRRCAGTLRGTSSPAPARGATPRGRCSEPLTGQESHMIARAAGADALVLVPAGEGELAAGERVRYLPSAARAERLSLPPHSRSRAHGRRAAGAAVRCARFRPLRVRARTGRRPVRSAARATASQAKPSATTIHGT